MVLISDWSQSVDGWPLLPGMCANLNAINVAAFLYTSVLQPLAVTSSNRRCNGCQPCQGDWHWAPGTKSSLGGWRIVSGTRTACYVASFFVSTVSWFAFYVDDEIQEFMKFQVKYYWIALALQASILKSSASFKKKQQSTFISFCEQRASECSCYDIPAHC